MMPSIPKPPPKFNPMTPSLKLLRRVQELEDEIKKNRRNYLQAMKEKDEEIIRLENDLEIAQNIAAATQAELDGANAVIKNLERAAGIRES